MTKPEKNAAYGRFQLNPMQADAFASMHAGIDVAITGPGGTGKSTAMFRFLYDIAARNNDSIEKSENIQKQDKDKDEDEGENQNKNGDKVIHLVSLRQPSSSPCQWFGFHQLDQLIDSWAQAKKDGKRTILAIDEYGLIAKEWIYRLSGYDQIIATGDPAQDNLAQIPYLFANFMKARGARLYIADQIWRSSHLPTTWMLDYYAYHGHFTTTPNRAGTMPDTYRMAFAGRNKAETALKISARIIRSHILNPGYSCHIAIRDPEIIENVTTIVSAAQFNSVPQFMKHFIDPACIQGLETDILLLYCPDLDQSFRTPRSIAKLATTLFGRCRHRLEFMITPDRCDQEPEANGAAPANPYSFTNFLKLILAHGIEGTVSSQMTEFADIKHKLRDHQADLIPIEQGVAIHNQQNNKIMQVLRSIHSENIRERILSLITAEQNARRLGWQEPIRPDFIAGELDIDIPSLKALRKR